MQTRRLKNFKLENSFLLTENLQLNLENRLKKLLNSNGLRAPK